MPDLLKWLPACWPRQAAEANGIERIVNDQLRAPVATGAAEGGLQNAAVTAAKLGMPYGLR
ncbi:hypothetical protein D3C84_916060 [compost metagenome]